MKNNLKIPPIKKRKIYQKDKLLFFLCEWGKNTRDFSHGMNCPFILDTYQAFSKLIWSK